MRKKHRLPFAMLSLLLVLGITAETAQAVSYVSSADCPHGGSPKTIGYVGCALCGGSGVDYDSVPDGGSGGKYSGSTLSKGSGTETKEEILNDGQTKAVTVYRCSNCGDTGYDCKQYDEIVEKRYYKRNDTKNSWDLDVSGTEAGPASEAQGYIPRRWCTVCGPEGAPYTDATWAQYHFPKEVTVTGSASISLRDDGRTLDGSYSVKVTGGKYDTVRVGWATVAEGASQGTVAYQNAGSNSDTASGSASKADTEPGYTYYLVVEVTADGKKHFFDSNRITVAKPTPAPNPPDTPALTPELTPKPTPLPYEHAWNMVYDDTSHWEVCGCGQTQNHGSHRLYQLPLGHGCTEERCSVCAFRGKKTHVHDFSGRWLYGDTNHWKECQWPCCRQAGESAAHSFRETAEGGYIVSTCGVCGYSTRRPVKYEVEYDRNSPDARGSMPVQEFVYDAPQALSANGYSLTYTTTRKTLRGS